MPSTFPILLFLFLFLLKTTRTDFIAITAYIVQYIDPQHARGGTRIRARIMSMSMSMAR
jgi:hypothetical protein